MNNFDVYPLWPIEPVKALGCKIWDTNGNEYLDLYGGHAVISIGHCHHTYNSMIGEQLSKLGFYSNAVINSLQQELAHNLGEACGYPDYSLFLCNSGAEANENALKLASFHTGKSKFIAFNKAFHGRTSGAVEATDNPKIRAPFNENGNITFLPLNEIEAVERELSTNLYSGIIIEGIQGVGGIIVPDLDFFGGIATLCNKYGALLILDEVQSGYGRTGKFFAHQHASIQPDIISMAKGMGNGFPIGGIIISPKIKAHHGMLGTTFGGNHLACTAALAVLKVIKEENLIDNAAKMGEYIMSALSSDVAIKEIRGKGLMIGIELKEEYSGLREKLLFDEHIFTGAAGKNIIRLLPPLSIDMQSIQYFIQAWRHATKNFNGK